MNSASIILLLQMAVSLLTNPQIQTNSTFKAQAFDFAAQAVSLANLALQQPAETTIQTVIATTTPPVMPDVPTSTPEQPVVSQPVEPTFGAVQGPTSVSCDEMGNFFWHYDQKNIVAEFVSHRENGTGVEIKQSSLSVNGQAVQGDVVTWDKYPAARVVWTFDTSSSTSEAIVMHIETNWQQCDFTVALPPATTY